MRRTAQIVSGSIAVLSFLVQSATALPPPSRRVTATLLLSGPLTFGDRIALSGGSIGTAVPEMAVSGRNVYVTWPSGAGVSEQVYAIRSDNGGASFKDRANVSNTSARSHDPAIAASGNSVYVVWRDEFSRDGDIFIARSENNGGAFHPRVNLSNSPGVGSRAPVIAASGNLVHVAWVEDVEMGTDVFLRTSSDYGASFGDAVNISEAVERGVFEGIPVYRPVGSAKVAIAAVGRSVYVAWQNSIAEYARRGVGIEMVREYLATVWRSSSDGGATFGDPVILTESASVWGQPRIAVAGRNVYVVWPDSVGVSGGNEDIALRASTDGGMRFGGLVNLSNTAARSTDPHIAASGNGVYVAWRDDVGGDEDILFRASTDAGARFGGVLNLSDNTGNSVAPSVAALGTNVYVAWQQAGGGYSILFRSSSDSGARFGEAIDLSSVVPHGSSQAPTVMGYGGSVYAVWQDHAQGAVFRRGTRSSRPPLSSILIQQKAPAQGSSEKQQQKKPIMRRTPLKP